MAIYTIKDTTLKKITDTIRNTANITGSIKTKDIPNYISANFVSKGEIDKIIEGTITSIYNTNVQSVRAYAFNDCSNLTDITFTEATSIGQNAFDGCVSLVNLNVPKASSIGANAFKNCSNIETICAGVTEILSTDAIGVNLINNTHLKEITFSNCITMQSSVCQGCTSLEVVNLPNITTTKQKQFYGRSSLSEINLPNSSTVGTSTFQNCINLAKVSMPLLTSIWPNGFYNCSSLKELYAPKLVSYSTTPFGAVGVSTDGGNLAWTSVTAGFTTVPALWSNQSHLIDVNMSNATTVAANAFKNCTSLSDISHIGGRIYTSQSSAQYRFIQYASFVTSQAVQKGFYYLSNVTFNNNAFENTGIQELSLGTSWFAGPSYINNQCIFVGWTTSPPRFYTLPSELGQINIGQRCFANCAQLSKINIGQEVSLKDNAFQNCTALTDVVLKSLVTYTVASGVHPFNGCTALENLRIGGTLTTIPQSAFINLTALANVDLLNASIIGIKAFYNCTSLNSVSIPEVEKLYASAFAHCSALETITLPNINNISATAFGSCTNLTEIHLTGSSVATLANVNAFVNTPLSVSTLTGNFGSIYVPASLYESYIAATNWKNYKDRIVSV